MNHDAPIHAILKLTLLSVEGVETEFLKRRMISLKKHLNGNQFIEIANKLAGLGDHIVREVEFIEYDYETRILNIGLLLDGFTASEDGLVYGVLGGRTLEEVISLHLSDVGTGLIEPFNGHNHKLIMLSNGSSKAA